MNLSRIEQSNPAPGLRDIDRKNIKNYLIILLFEEDTARILNVERLHVFSRFEELEDYLRITTSYSFYITPDRSMVVFQLPECWIDVFANIFVGVNHLNMSSLKLT